MASVPATLAKLRSPAILVAQNGTSLALPNYMADEVEQSRASIIAAMCSSSSLTGRSRRSHAGGAYLDPGDAEDDRSTPVERELLLLSLSHANLSTSALNRASPASPRVHPEQPQPAGPDAPILTRERTRRSSACATPPCSSPRRGLPPSPFAVSMSVPLAGGSSHRRQSTFGSDTVPSGLQPEGSTTGLLQGNPSRRPLSASASTQAQVPTGAGAAAAAAEEDLVAAVTGRFSQHCEDEDSFDEEELANELEEAQGTLARALEMARKGHVPKGAAGAAGSRRRGGVTAEGELSPTSQPFATAAQGPSRAAGPSQRGSNTSSRPSMQVLELEITPASSFSSSQATPGSVRRASADALGTGAAGGAAGASTGYTSTRKRSGGGILDRVARTSNADGSGGGGGGGPVSGPQASGGRLDDRWSFMSSGSVHSRTVSNISASGASSVSGSVCMRTGGVGVGGRQAPYSGGAQAAEEVADLEAASPVGSVVDVSGGGAAARGGSSGIGRFAARYGGELPISEHPGHGGGSHGSGGGGSSLKGLLKLAKKAFRRSTGSGSGAGGKIADAGCTTVDSIASGRKVITVPGGCGTVPSPSAQPISGTISATGSGRSAAASVPSTPIVNRTSDSQLSTYPCHTAWAPLSPVSPLTATRSQPAPAALTGGPAPPPLTCPTSPQQASSSPPAWAYSGGGAAAAAAGACCDGGDCDAAALPQAMQQQQQQQQQLSTAFSCSARSLQADFGSGIKRSINDDEGELARRFSSNSMPPSGGGSPGGSSGGGPGSTPLAAAPALAGHRRRYSALAPGHGNPSISELQVTAHVQSFLHYQQQLAQQQQQQCPQNSLPARNDPQTWQADAVTVSGEAVSAPASPAAASSAAASAALPQHSSVDFSASLAAVGAGLGMGLGLGLGPGTGGGGGGGWQPVSQVPLPERQPLRRSQAMCLDSPQGPHPQTSQPELQRDQRLLADQPSQGRLESGGSSGDFEGSPAGRDAAARGLAGITCRRMSGNGGEDASAGGDGGGASSGGSVAASGGTKASAALPQHSSVDFSAGLAAAAPAAAATGAAACGGDGRGVSGEGSLPPPLPIVATVRRSPRSPLGASASSYSRSPRTSGSGYDSPGAAAAGEIAGELQYRRSSASGASDAGSRRASSCGGPDGDEDDIGRDSGRLPKSPFGVAYGAAAAAAAAAAATIAGVASASGLDGDHLSGLRAGSSSTTGGGWQPMGSPGSRRSPRASDNGSSAPGSPLLSGSAQGAAGGRIRSSGCSRSSGGGGGGTTKHSETPHESPTRHGAAAATAAIVSGRRVSGTGAGTMDCPPGAGGTRSGRFIANPGAAAAAAHMASVAAPTSPVSSAALPQHSSVDFTASLAAVAPGSRPTSAPGSGSGAGSSGVGVPGSSPRPHAPESATSASAAGGPAARAPRGSNSGSPTTGSPSTGTPYQLHPNAHNPANGHAHALAHIRPQPGSATPQPSQLNPSAPPHLTSAAAVAQRQARVAGVSVAAPPGDVSGTSPCSPGLQCCNGGDRLDSQLSSTPISPVSPTLPLPLHPPA